MNSTSEQQDAQHLRMTTAPVPGLILSLSVPSIITCIITSVYNMADTFFVAQLGTAAVAAVGVVFSISSVLSALGFWMGTGGSSLVSLYLGAREKEKAHCAASTGFFLALGLGGVIAAGGLLALEPLMRLLGSTDTILPEAEAYAVPILLAAPFHCSSLALAQCLRAEGKSKESMAGQLAGGLLNIVLDPLFIYTLGMGIRGAGAATALSQVMVWAALLWFYVRGKTSVRISVRQVARTPRMVKLIFTTGFPSLCRHCGNALATIVLNRAAGGFGDAAIAAFSIASRVSGLALSVSIGFVQGLQPVAGYAHGSKDHARLKSAFRFCCAASMSALTALAVIDPPDNRAMCGYPAGPLRAGAQPCSDAEMGLCGPGQREPTEPGACGTDPHGRVYRGIHRGAGGRYLCGVHGAGICGRCGLSMLRAGEKEHSEE